MFNGKKKASKNDWRQSIMSLGQVKNEANESESQTTRRMPFGRTGRTDRPQSQHMPTATMPNGPATGMQVAAQAAPPQKRKRFKVLIYAFAFLMVFALGVGAGSLNASKPAGTVPSAAVAPTEQIDAKENDAELKRREEALNKQAEELDKLKRELDEQQKSQSERQTQLDEREKSIASKEEVKKQAEVEAAQRKKVEQEQAAAAEKARAEAEAAERERAQAQAAQAAAEEAARQQEQAPQVVEQQTSRIVHPGAFCSTAGETGVSQKGVGYTCKADNIGRLRWRR